MSTYAPLKNGSLSNIRVVDITRAVAGPYCSMILGDMGAEIIKIENPNGGDFSRNWGPSINNSQDSYFYASLNRNKKSVCVNFKSTSGRDIIYELCSKSDVLIENYVPGVLEKYGLSYRHLKPIAPHLIYCSITGFGPTGPYTNRRGYDIIASSYGGLNYITGPLHGEPCKTGVPFTDISTGLYAHGAILAALYQRTYTGRGQQIHCNLLSTQLACLTFMGSSCLNTEVDEKRWGTSHPNIVPYRSYKALDGRYITIGATNDKHFADVCRRLDLEHLTRDERYQTNEKRVKNRESLDNEFEKRFVEKSASEWLKIFENAPFPWGPVNSIKEAFEDEHVRDIGIVQSIKHSDGTEVKYVGPVVEFGESPCDIRLPPPMLGQHTSSVLKDILGYSTEKIDSLKEIGATL